MGRGDQVAASSSVPHLAWRLRRRPDAYWGNGARFGSVCPSVFTRPFDNSSPSAAWRSKWLTSAVGEAVTVKPVLVFPGWFVERKSASDVAIIGATNARQYFLKAQGAGISEKLLAQITHQLDTRCRDVQPRAYVHDE